MTRHSPSRQHHVCAIWSSCALSCVVSACSADPHKVVERPAAAAAEAGAAAVGGGGRGPLLTDPATLPSTPSTFTDDTDAATPECGRQKFSVAPKPADIMLVLDRSGSMKEDANGDDKAPSKWDVVVPALNQAISATGDKVSWGLWLFPAGDDAGECKAKSYPRDIAVPLRPNNAGPVNDAIAGATPKGDGTPTGDAVNEALKYLKTIPDDNPKYILLATDGEPSCAGTNKGSSDARTAAVNAVQSAADAGVHTFVVGIATTKDSASKTLTELAKAGREPPASGYYLASDQKELVDALERITGSVASCRFPLSAAPPDPAHIGVLIGTQAVHKDASDKEGWNFVDQSMMEIELFGGPCAMVMHGGVQPVNVVFGCKDDMLF